MVDLEWGLSNRDRELGTAMSEFKAKELQKCHDISVGPSFVVCISLQSFINRVTRNDQMGLTCSHAISNSVPIYPLQRVFLPPKFGLYPQK